MQQLPVDPDFNTLLITVMGLGIALIVLFWHEKLSGFLMGSIGKDDQIKSKIDFAIFIASIVIVAACALWLLRLVVE